MTAAHAPPAPTTKRHLRAWMQHPGYPALFDALGHDRARFVGGCVRDSLLGRPFGDVDIACQLDPGQVQERLQASKIRHLATGLKHGTITALLPSPDQPGDWHKVEITSLRKDLRTDGRHAEVGFTQDWQCDAARRDLTMNALYLGFDGQIYDPLGTGIADARAGLVRFVGDPSQRIKEDYLRLLRFFRFAASYARQPLERETLTVCQALAPGLEHLSGERIQAELLKLLSLPTCGPILEIMEARCIMRAIWPGARPVDHALTCLQRFADLKATPDPLLILRAWLGPEAQDRRAIARRLRLSNDDAERLAWPLVDLNQDDARLLYRHGRRAALDSLLLADTTLWTIRRFERLSDIPVPQFPLQGRDLITAGLAPGPALGRRLAATQEWWAQGGFQADTKACLAWALEQPSQ